MKKFLFTLVFTLSALASFAQKRELEVKEFSTDLQGIGMEFPLSNKVTGSDWFPTFRVLMDEQGYRISLIIRDPNLYYKMYEDESLYLKLDDGTIIECPVIIENGVQNYVLQGTYANGIYYQDRRVTQADFRLPDYDRILGNQITKIRFFINEHVSDYDLKKDGYVKKFTKKFKDSARVAKADYKKKEFARSNPTAGF